MPGHNIPGIYRRAGEETVTIETLARCSSWLVDVVREKYEHP